jgi:hypothetical protein
MALPDDVPAASFPKMAFGGDAGPRIEFPYSDLSVRGAIRYADHEFPHTPGAELEKQGRKPYVITCTAHFHYVQGSELDKQYPDLYPDRLNALRAMFEKEITDALVVPNIGTVKAVAVNWTQTFNVRTPTGETVQLEFREDQDGLESFAVRDAPPDLTLVLEANEALLAAVALADFKKELTKGVFQEINDAVTAVQAGFGQADAYSRLIEGKIRAVENLCVFADGQLEEMQNPEHHLVLNALKDLWFSSKDLAENVVGAAELKDYRVPKVMSVGQIAAALYGSTDRTVEILKLNEFADALAIPPGTLVVYSP